MTSSDAGVLSIVLYVHLRVKFNTTYYLNNSYTITLKPIKEINNTFIIL